MCNVRLSHLKVVNIVNISSWHSENEISTSWLTRGQWQLNVFLLYTKSITTANKSHLIFSTTQHGVRNRETFPTRTDERTDLPIMFPNAHTACSHTFWCGEYNSLRNRGTAPHSTTAFVCSDVPEAMFVSAQAASNCKLALQCNA